VRSYVCAQWTVARWSHKQMNPMLIYVCCIRLKLNIYFLYWYFQQNQCLKIKNYAVYNIHRLAWGSFACGTTGQLSIVPIHKTAQRTVIYISRLYCAFSNKKILNIDKYFVCESRDIQSDESGAYIILLKLKTILFTWR
jgi:hypothetical protein